MALLVLIGIQVKGYCNDIEEFFVFLFFGSRV